MYFSQGTRERSVPTEHFFNVLTKLVLFRSDRTFLLKIQEHWNIFSVPGNISKELLRNEMSRLYSDWAEKTKNDEIFRLIIFREVYNWKLWKNLRTKMTWYVIQVYFPLFVNVPRNKMGTFFNVLSEQNITEHFFGVERSVLTEHLDPMFPRTLLKMIQVKLFKSIQGLTIKNL